MAKSLKGDGVFFRCNRDDSIGALYTNLSLSSEDSGELDIYEGPRIITRKCESCSLSLRRRWRLPALRRAQLERGLRGLRRRSLLGQGPPCMSVLPVRVLPSGCVLSCFILAWRRGLLPPSCPPTKVKDVCGVCGGSGSFDACSRCLPPEDPKRIEEGEGGFDDCGVCLRYNDARWNKSCLGCDGVLNSGKVRDVCGVCDGTGSLDQCLRCLQADDPTRVDEGGYDACGACLPTGHPNRVEEGGIDACGLCMPYSDPRFNKTCAGCDGVPNSLKQRDVCGECGGSETDTSACNAPSKDALTEGQIVGITLGAVAVAGLLGYCCLQKQQRAMKNDIDGLIRQYQQLDGDGKGADLLQGKVRSDSAAATSDL